ncbi:hypothetical protein GIB67_037586 [Kingdonia uniflora]|uniref:RNase H type-1 domain-containing protein n=1 Tax=Kingdonia uniflora TaxID=39325 RepID=A0A7J7LSC8_9MAGN|nr:hypothetical protein GIB67_037586 [Kingdonia uniflora]
MGFTRDRRIGRKTAELHVKFFGHHDLDWDRPELMKLLRLGSCRGLTVEFSWRKIKDSNECGLGKGKVQVYLHVSNGVLLGGFLISLPSCSEYNVCLFVQRRFVQWQFFQRLIDEEVEENEASISGRASMDKGSDLEVLDVVTDPPLTAVVPAGGVLTSRGRKTVVTEGSDEQYIGGGERNEGNPGPSGAKMDEVEQSDQSGDSTESDKAQGSISTVDKMKQDQFATKLELSKVEENLRNYIGAFLDSREEWVNSIFEFLGIKRKRKKKTDSLVRNEPITPKPTKKRRGEGGSKVSNDMGENDLTRTVQYVRKAKRALKQATPVPEVASDASRLRRRQHKRHRAHGEDDAADEDEEMTEAERQDQAITKIASMAKLCDADPDEALKKMKKTIYQAQFDGECRVIVRLKKFIEYKGYDPDTLEPFPAIPELVAGDTLQMKEGEADAADIADGGAGDGVEASVIEATSIGIVTDVADDGAGSNLLLRLLNNDRLALRSPGRVVLLKKWSIGVFHYKESCVVGWNKTCQPRKEGGIDIRSLKGVNLTLLMKLAWNFLNGQDDWAKFIRAKFNSKAGNRIYSTQGSSVWAGIRGAVSEVEQQSGWIVGDGNDIDLWRDNWCHQRPLKDLIDSNDIPWHCFKDKETAYLSKAVMNNTTKDFSILYCLRVPCHPRQDINVRSCFWNLPEEGEVKINSDGASKGNPGKGGAGVIIRNCRGAIFQTMMVGLGNVTSYMAECMTLVQGQACAASNGWEIEWLESNSSEAVKAFNNNLIP